jgi:NADPH-dependent 2,4-dienoyl-CoA reductase/sulfur reductase-like enzyme
VLVGSRIAIVGSGRYAASLVEQMQGAVELVQLDAESVVRASGRERISAVEVKTEQGMRRIKVDALAFDGAGAPSFELAVQAGASVDFDPRAGYFPRADEAGKLAERLYVA